jgi:hypothetical protein
MKTMAAASEMVKTGEVGSLRVRRQSSEGWKGGFEVARYCRQLYRHNVNAGQNTRTSESRQKQQQ